MTVLPPPPPSTNNVKKYSKFKKIDCLINNAGVAIHNPILEIREKDWDTSFYVNLTANQVDVGEDLRIFIGNFERQDSSGNWVAVDPSDIGGISGFRPSVFATYSNNFF